MPPTLALLAAAGLSTVAIDLPEDATPETVARVVESCNAALGGARCEAARPDGNDTTLVASVRFDGATLDIRLVRLAPPAGEVERRRVDFSEGDAASDRLIAAGLMVAALTAAQPARVEPEPPPEAPAATSAPAPPPPAPPTHAGLDAALKLGPGLDGGDLRLGGMLGVWWMPHDLRVGARGGVAYLVASDPTQLTWGSVSLGGVTRLTAWGSPVSVMLSAEAMLQRASATAERDGASESADVVRWGGRLAARLGLDLGAPVEPWLGWELTLLNPAFEVRLGSDRVGAEGSLSHAFCLGITVFVFG